MMNADGTNQTQFTQGPSAARNPDWQPLAEDPGYAVFELATPTPVSSITPTIAHDADGSGTAVNSSTVNWNHTVGSGSDRFLVVGLASSVNSASSVTYGGTAMTRIGARATGSRHIVEMWVLANPASGTNAIAATFIVSKDRVGFSTSWENVDPASAVGSFAHHAGTTVGPLRVDVATAEGDMVVDISVANGRPVTVDASQTERGNDSAVSVHAGMSSEPASGTSVTMSWTISDSTSWAIAAIPLRPTDLPATAAPTPTLSPTTAGLPSTGGVPSDVGSGSLPWLAAVGGAVALLGVAAITWRPWRPVRR